MKKIILFLIILIILIIWSVVFFYSAEEKNLDSIKSFEDCEKQGYPVKESYPRQCMTPDGRNFVEEVSEPIDQVPIHPLIKVSSPQLGETITSPLVVQGEARGNWYFEASFPVTLEDTNGNVLVETFAQAQGEWMTTEFVPFETTLNFNSGSLKEGVIVLHKDNPSGLPENDDRYEIPVNFSAQNETEPSACRPTGCSSQICSDEDVVTTCESLPEYACYAFAVCERQVDGECGWTETEEFNNCLSQI